MTGGRRFEQQLPNALADLAMTPYPAYIDDVLEITARTPRRPAWQFPARWLPFEPEALVPATLRSPQLRRAALVVTVILLIAALIAVYIGSSQPPDPYGLARNGMVAYSADHATWVLDESGATRLLLDGEGDEFPLAYSRDGTRLAFIRALSDHREYLWAADADGTRQVQLLAEPLPPGQRIDWSPDSRRIVLSTRVGGLDRIRVVEADGSGSRILSLPFPARDAGWRPPDGHELAVRGEVNGFAQLFVVAADGPTWHEIGPRAKGLFLGGSVDGRSWDHQGLEWSPDGTRLAYNSIDAAPGARGFGSGPDDHDDLRFQVHVIEADGTDHPLAGPDIDTMESWPSWSPDGRLIAFERWKWNGLSWLAILPADGSGPGLDIELKAMFEPATGWSTTWSPDGTRMIAFWEPTRRAVSIDVATGDFEPLDLPLVSTPTWQRR